MAPALKTRLSSFLGLSLVATAIAVVALPQVVYAQEAHADTVVIDLARSETAHRRAPGGSASTAVEKSSRQLIAAEVRGFTAIGVTLREPPDSQVRVRVRQVGGWTPWRELTFDLSEGPDGEAAATRPGAHTQVLWFGDADAYELDLPVGPPSAEVHLVRETATAKVVTGSAAGAAPPGTASRAAWGARPPKRTPSTTTDLKAAIVHHSVSSNTYTASQVPSMLRAIQAYHMDVNGWDDIAYNFAVDRFGRRWEGRAGGMDNIVLGGHSAGFNTATVGVVALGDFRSVDPPTAVIEAISHVIAWSFALHAVEPSSVVPYTTNGSSKHPPGKTLLLRRIIGHRDAQTTTCPGARLYARLGAIRSRVGELVPAYQRAAPASLLTLDQSADGLRDALHYTAGSSPDLWWRATGSTSFAKAATAVQGAYKTAVGDFDGNGRSDILWHGGGSSGDSIWWSTTSQVRSTALRVDGSYVPVSGDFDGDGNDDVLWYAPGLAPDSVWYFSSDGTYQSRSVRQDLITARPVVGDFTGDGLDDVLWYGPGPADDFLWVSTGRGWSIRSVTISGYYSPVALSVNHDAFDDVVWVAVGAGTSSRWEFGTDGSYTSRRIEAPVPYGVPHVGDFDGDGLDDVLLYAAGSAPDAVWYSTEEGTDPRMVSIRGEYQLSVGATNAPSGPTDVLFASTTGVDNLWIGRTDRTFSSFQVG